MKNKDGKYLISTHSFMLPLRWDYLPMGYGPDKDMLQFSFDERTDMGKMNDFLLKSGWERKFYRINNEATNYNEITYFHAFVSKTIFDLQQSDESDTNIVHANKVMTYYEIEPNDGEDAYFKIDAKGQIYKLELKGISLHCFNTGVSIITFNLENYDYANSEDILAINEFGRRIHPQFLIDATFATSAVKNVFHPTSIEIYCSKINKGLPLIEDFKHYDLISNMETHSVINNTYEHGTIIKLPNFITGLFNASYVFNAKSQIENTIRLNLLADDRMFFQCWYGDKTISAQISEQKSDIFLYAFINGDRSVKELSIANDELRDFELKEKVYKRWLGYGTIYGFSRDSFVCASTDAETLGGMKIYVHMKTMYYQMAVLSLAQRVSVLRFSAEVTNLTDLGKPNKKNTKIDTVELIEKLHLNYIEFINKIYFREVSSQIQGIEIYEMFQKVMHIGKDVTDLDGEIKELFNYASMIRQEQQQNESHRLTNIATWFLPAGVIVGIMGMNAFGKDDMNWGGSADWAIWRWIIFAIGFSLFVAEALFKFKHIKNLIKWATLKNK